MDQLPIFLIGIVVWLAVGLVFLLRSGRVPARLVGWYRRAAYASFLVAGLDAVLVLAIASGIRPPRF